jgi:hypothetical protein
MAWIKRNLLFVIGSVVAVALLGAAGFYDFKTWNHNSAAFGKLNEIYTNLRNLAGQKPSPGNGKINNIETAKEQDSQVRQWIEQAGKYFQPIPPVPDPANGVVTSEDFAGSLRRTIDQLRHEAEDSSVILPPNYNFSFEAQRSLVRFSPGSLNLLATQLGEVKSISEILFSARVNSLDSIQRIRVSEDDMNGPQADYINDQSVTNDLAIMTPYQITFRSFSQEIARVLSGFASSPHGFVVKGINVQPAANAAAASPDMNDEQQPNYYNRREEMAPYNNRREMAPTRGGLQTVLNEQLLQITMVVEVVKLRPKK